MQLFSNGKGTAIHRSERICIDISDSVVSVIKLDPQGVMMRAGSAKAPTLPGMPDDAYVTDLSAAIKKAAWAAKVSMGFGASCVVGASMPDMTIQRFRWPDMPTDALLGVAATEMAPYLPHSKSNFHIACEVLREENGELEVLVAAMPEEHAIAVETACRWANFKPKRIDIRENARSRLVQHWCAPIEGMLPSTFAVLDAGPGAANIAFYHNGLFHSNRYFAPEFVKLDEVEDFEMLMSVKAGGIGNNECAMRYDTGKLNEEIISAIDHFHRLTGGDNISCILLMDDENIPGIEESLRAGFNAPVLKPSQWVKPGVKRPNLRRINQDSFLDAFAVGMPSLIDHDCRMDLSIPNTQVVGPGGTPAEASVARQYIAPVAEEPTADSLASGAGVVVQQADGLQAEGPFVGGSDAGSARHDSGPVPSGDRFAQDAIQSDNETFNDNLRDRADFNEGPRVIPAGYVELPELPPELADLEHMPSYDMLAEDRLSGMRELSTDENPGLIHGHADQASESPFDVVAARAGENKGFPYAIPEDPRPDPSARKPLFAAIAIVVVILIIAILIPQRTTSSLRAELAELQESMSAYPSLDELFLREQERLQIDRQINAIRSDMDRVNDRTNIVRNFYLRLPAMVFVPEVLEASGLQVDSITAVENAYEHRIEVSGRTNDLVGMVRGVRYLREHFHYQYLLTIVFDYTPVDSYGFTDYTLTITVDSGWAPFWLNRYAERRWQ